ncbi:type I secretion system permease/ATPase [Rhizobium sp. C1]|uniref:type I secretion system permease/ATPase n=1 Tax=Rhizobium sp. C1 TaxID=1349799 RepID=UPI001E41ED87|nr:type I secretion system permease/ATPase [Rhizobium sp. C1]MCD2177931.1 type I secretion system permease/ATPase [Rhizobium sp. C1]
MRSVQGESAPPVSLSAVLKGTKSILTAVALLSGVINVLALTGSFFMLQVYDRVIPSKSLPTLVGLVVLAGTLYAFYGLLELIRGRLLIRLGWLADRRMSGPIFDATMRLPLKARLDGDGLQTLRDLDQVRSFMSGMGPAAFFDLPWMPVYIGISFLFHPWIGVFALACAILLSALALVAEMRAKGPVAAVSRKAAERQATAQTIRQNIEVLWAMGFYGRLAARWHRANDDYLAEQASASDKSGGLSSVSKIMRMLAQSGMLALGAALVLDQQTTGGIMIASSILLSRSLAPVEQAIAHWKGFVSARQSWARLKKVASIAAVQTPTVALPAPSEAMMVRGVTIVAPGGNMPIVREASFALKAGDGLGIIGPSASGKSTLLRALVGIWTPVRGDVRLDGATLDQWPLAERGRHIGFLPQSVSLFDGTIADNIARFDPQKSSEAVLKAAQAAGVHEMIVQMPEGYDTQIGDQGAFLSAGQRQRIGLARALYGDPFLVVLDEPNSNLDAEGEAALTAAIAGVRSRGGIAIIVAHRPNALLAVDKVMAMGGGRIQAFGPKEEVLQQVTRPVMPASARPVRLIANQDDAP